MIPCVDCGGPIPPSWERCPHCARPGLFPNVRSAEQDSERRALETRYTRAIDDAESRGCRAEVGEFEAAVGGSRAVIARSIAEAQRLATSDNELYATYYQLIDAGVRIAPGNSWDVLRVLTDDALFPGYKQNIRFAALTLDGLGLSNYGACSMVLRTDRIAHRATVFEENTVTWMTKHQIRVSSSDRLPQGYRATWEERGKLAVAKLAGEIDPGLQAESFPGLLLDQGSSTREDRFIEVHIWGPLTVRSLECVVAARPADKPGRAILTALEERLASADVRLEVRS